MTDQPSNIRDIMLARLEITQQISAATAEHLRLTQIASGMEVLELGGDDSDATRDGQARTRAALEECEARIAALEERMAALDRRLDAITTGEDT